MEPIYRNIEFVRDSDTLWGKLKEGRWDWLAVHPKGGFVLGSPPRRGVSSIYAALETGPKTEHGVAVISHPSREDNPALHWHPDEASAKADFAARVADYEGRDGPLIMRVKCMEKGRVVDEHYVVKAPSTYPPNWRPPPEDQ
jgi:hypothetical protein